MAQWLSWLERRPVTAEVTGSSPVWVVHKWTTVERLLCILCINYGILAQLGARLVSKHTPSQMVLRQSIPNKKLHPRGSLLGFYGGLAQLGERLHGMQEVTGSIPVFSTKKALYFV